MKYKAFRLQVTPAFEMNNDYKEFEYPTKNMLVAAHTSMADLLLFMQDEVKCMDDYSNMFAISVLPAGNSGWIEIEEDELINWEN